MEYAKWDNFHKVIKRAMSACENVGHSILDQFPEVGKTPEKSIQQIEKEQMERLQKKAKAGKLMLDE